MEIKEFFNRFGVNTTSNFQILQWAKQLKVKNFHVLLRDEIKDFNSKKLPVNLIVNIDPKKEGGVHWSYFCIAEDRKNIGLIHMVYFL